MFGDRIERELSDGEPWGTQRAYPLTWGHGLRNFWQITLNQQPILMDELAFDAGIEPEASLAEKSNR